MTKKQGSAFPLPLRTVEGIVEYKLNNGLTVLLFPDNSAQTVTVNITYLVGSRHEGRGEAGMAHLLEHMLFKGTPNHPNIKAVLDDRGAFYNGTTSFDRTNYYETFSATDDTLEMVLKLEADRMINSSILQSDFDTEMSVVRNEFEMGKNNPVHVLHDQIIATAYQWHNYSKTTIGNRSDIERVPVKKLKAFYEHYYQPDNAVLIVAGHFNIQKTQEWILQYFSIIPKPTRVLDDTYTEEPVQEGPREVKLLRMGDVAQSAVAYHIPAASHPDFVALEVLSEILCNEPSGILYQLLVESGESSELFTLLHGLKEPGLFMVFARPSHNEQVSELLGKMLGTLENLSQTEITAERVERAKTSILAETTSAMKNSSDLAIQLSESIAQGDYRLFFYIRDQVKTITADDVLRVATTYLIESNRTTGLFIPIAELKRAIIPPVPDVDSMLDGYCGSEEIHLGEAFEATTENIDAHTVRRVLAGTIKTAILPKSTRGQGNLTRLIFRFGDEASLHGKGSLLKFIPNLLCRGTTQMTFQQVKDTLDKFQSSLNLYSVHPGVVFMDIASNHRHLEDVIALASDLMRSPRFSQEEFKRVHQRHLADLKASSTDPMTLGMTELLRLQNPYHVDSIHYVPTVDEMISGLKAVTFESAQRAYIDLYSANHLEVAVVGDFDPSILTSIESHFGNWSSSIAYHPIVAPYVPALAELRTLITPDKKMAVVAIGANFAMRDDDIHYPAIAMANYILGESMQSRLIKRLREQEGLSYGASSNIDISQYEAAANITLYAMCDADKADLTLKLMLEEYHRWLKDGVTEQELIESKQSNQLAFNNSLANDAFKIQKLSSMLNVNRTFGYYAEFLNRVEQLQIEDIQKALDIFLQNAPVARVKAGDFMG